MALLIIQFDLLDHVIKMFSIVLNEFHHTIWQSPYILNVTTA